MTGCQSCSFVKEEQLSVLARRHDGMSSAMELKEADDPALASKSAPNPPLIVVQAAAVSHERPAGRGGYQGAKWSYTILSRHPKITTSIELARLRLPKKRRSGHHHLISSKRSFRKRQTGGGPLMRPKRSDTGAVSQPHCAGSGMRSDSGTDRRQYRLNRIQLFGCFVENRSGVFLCISLQGRQADV